MISGKPSLPESTLHTIVNDLIQESASLVMYNKNYVVNNVPADLRVEANSAIVTSVLNRLLETALRHTKNSVILISARLYGMAVLVQVKSKGTISPGLPEDIGHACVKAKKTGGIIEMIDCANDQASIAYCFLNVAGAA